MIQSQSEKQKYDEMVKQVSPNSPVFLNCIKAFVSGGFICTIGQVIHNFIANYSFTEDEASLITSIVLIFTSALLTGLGLYERLGKFCGAGTIVPITGFANSVVSPAIEFKKEGLIFGMAAKMFIVAGPVIVYGVLTSMVVGFIYFFVG